MKRMMPGFALVLALAQPGKAQQNANTPGLKDCIRYALAHHENSQIYANKVKASNEKIRESKSVLYPTITGTGSLDYNIKMQTSVIPAGALSDKDLHLQMGSKFSTGGYVEADQNLFDKANWLNISAARVDKNIADLNFKKQQELLVYNTAKAYYSVLSYSEKLRLLRENEKEYIQLEEILKLRYEQGEIKKSTYDKTRLDLINVRSEISSNENYYHLALNKLKNQMGATLDSTLVIDEHINFEETKPNLETPALPLSQLTDYNIDLQNIQQQEIAIKQKIHCGAGSTFGLNH